MDTASNVSASGAPAFNLVAGLVTWSLSVQSIRLGKDAYMAPDMVTRAALMRLSAQTTQAFKAVSTRSRELGVDALDNAQPFMGALGAYDERTRPAAWPERVLQT